MKRAVAAATCALARTRRLKSRALRPALEPSRAGLTLKAFSGRSCVGGAVRSWPADPPANQRKRTASEDAAAAPRRRERPRQDHRRPSSRFSPKTDRADRFRRDRRRRRRVLAQLRGEFSSTLAILAAYLKSIDRAVLAADFGADMDEEPQRERLFDVLMRRLEALAPYRDAVRSLVRSATPQSAARAGAQRARGALAAMDADRRRHRRVRSARHAARARARRAVRLGVAHLGSD